MKELPHLTRCELVGDTLMVETDAPIIEIAEFIGQEGKVLQHEEMINQARYVIQPNDPYVRVKLRLPNLTFFYLNPITRHQTIVPDDQVTAEINHTQTILFYFVYVLVMILCAVRVFKKQ